MSAAWRQRGVRRLGFAPSDVKFADVLMRSGHIAALLEPRKE